MKICVNCGREIISKWQYFCGKPCARRWLRNIKNARFYESWPIGTPKIRKDRKTKEPRVFIKISDTKWESRAQIIWEDKNGPLPRGYLICNINGDTMNDDILNLEILPINPYIPMGYRRCSRCGEIKTIDLFPTRERNWCRACGNNYTRIKRKTEKGKEAKKRAYIRSRLSGKELCHNKVKGAIRSGYLNRGNCIVCGEPDAHAHHEDYSKPFEITWLCRKHHNELHNKRRDELAIAKDRGRA